MSVKVTVCDGSAFCLMQFTFTAIAVSLPLPSGLFFPIFVVGKFSPSPLLQSVTPALKQVLPLAVWLVS